MNDVERIDRDELNVSRREVMAGSSVVAGAAVLGAVPRKVAAQQDPDNEISGTVTDAQGAVDGATVVAVPHDETLDPLSTTTASNGDYIFDESALHPNSNLYHVIARDGTESSPRRGQENYPFILANGGSAIPDSESLHSRYDATQLSLSDQDSITTWGDATGNGHDLTAGTAPTYLASGINGNPTVRFDGADDFLDVSFSSISQPVHIFAVIIDQNGGSGSAEYLWDGTGSNNAVSWRYAPATDTQAINAGSDVAVTPTQGTPIITSSLYNGASSSLRTNGGDQSASGDVGSADLENGFTLGARADESTFGAYDVGELLIYPEDKSSVQSDVEQYLADKWGITT